MDLLSSIRKSGSRGGVNFSWDEVSTSQHRENYLGHSLMAPVGRWQKGKDLNWYAKGDDAGDADGETAEERKVRERKEEIRRIKEAEEDALARALGLPVTDRTQTGANAITVGEMNKFMKEIEEGDQEIEEVGRGKGFGEFVGKLEDGLQDGTQEPLVPEKGGLLMETTEKVREGRKRDASRERRNRRHRHRSRSGDRERPRHRSRSGERHRYKRRHYDERRHPRERSRSPGRREHRDRSRSGDRRRARRDDREPRRDEREARRDADRKPRRSRSPTQRNCQARRG